LLVARCSSLVARRSALGARRTPHAARRTPLVGVRRLDVPAGQRPDSDNAFV